MTTTSEETLTAALIGFVAEHLDGLDPEARADMHADATAIVVDRDGRPSWAVVGPDAYAEIWFADDGETTIEGYTRDPVTDRDVFAKVSTDRCGGCRAEHCGPCREHWDRGVCHDCDRAAACAADEIA